VGKATAALEGLAVAAKNELLFQRGINFNALPAWQKRGVGLFWESFAKVGYNPLTQEQVTAQRRRVTFDYALPLKEAYHAFLQKLLAEISA